MAGGYNPVKHKLATCPHAWEWSTFGRNVRESKCANDWCCLCDGRALHEPPSDIAGAQMD